MQTALANFNGTTALFLIAAVDGVRQMIVVADCSLSSAFACVVQPVASQVCLTQSVFTMYTVFSASRGELFYIVIPIMILRLLFVKTPAAAVKKIYKIQVFVCIFVVVRLIIPARG